MTLSLSGTKLLIMPAGPIVAALVTISTREPGSTISRLCIIGIGSLLVKASSTPAPAFTLSSALSNFIGGVTPTESLASILKGGPSMMGAFWIFSISSNCSLGTLASASLRKLFKKPAKLLPPLKLSAFRYQRKYSRRCFLVQCFLRFRSSLA